MPTDPELLAALRRLQWLYDCGEHRCACAESLLSAIQADEEVANAVVRLARLLPGSLVELIEIHATRAAIMRSHTHTTGFNVLVVDMERSAKQHPHSVATSMNLLSKARAGAYRALEIMSTRSAWWRR